MLKTPPGSSEYLMYRDESADPPALVCVVGKTTLGYQLRALDDLHAMLKEHGDWMPLGSADEQKPAAEGTVEAWGRSPDNPVGGLVRPQEGPARALRDVHPAAHGGARPRRARAQPAQQPHARDLAVYRTGQDADNSRILEAILIGAGFLLGVILGRWWALLACVGFGVWIGVTRRSKSRVGFSGLATRRCPPSEWPLASC